jgi:hypothetical protein
MKTTTYTQEQHEKMIENLQNNQRAITSLRKIGGGTKIQFELAEKIERAEENGVNLLALMNKGDERFNQSKPRRAWMSAEYAQITAFFGISAEDLAEVSEDALNPTRIWIESPQVNGLDLHIKVTETISGTDYEMANIDTKAKRSGKDGAIQSFDGFPIFSHTEIVALNPDVKPVHTFLVSDQTKERNGEAKVELKVSAPTLD